MRTRTPRDGLSRAGVIRGGTDWSRAAVWLLRGEGTARDEGRGPLGRAPARAPGLRPRSCWEVGTRSLRGWGLGHSAGNFAVAPGQPRMERGISKPSAVTWGSGAPDGRWGPRCAPDGYDPNRPGFQGLAETHTATGNYVMFQLESWIWGVFSWFH